MAAPVAGNILREVLPYLEIDNNEETKEKVKMPNLVGMELKDAKKVLDENEIQYRVEGDIENSDNIVKSQIPEEMVIIEKESVVIINI